MAIGLTLLALACSPEREAQDVLERYDVVFEECRKISEEAGAEPGTHHCSKLASVALERALDDTGLDAVAREQLITTWRSNNPLAEFYADANARAAIPAASP